MKEWQQDLVFIVGIGGTVILFFSPAIPYLDSIPSNPTAMTGLGLILSYLFTQRRSRKDDEEDNTKKDEGKDGGEGDG